MKPQHTRAVEHNASVLQGKLIATNTDLKIEKLEINDLMTHLKVL